jgi:hypothetical protein
MASSTTVTFTPPHAFSAFTPRLDEATNVPSDVARGIRKSP